MTERTALVVGSPGPVAADLQDALAAAGIDGRSAQPEAVAATLREFPSPDLVLISASLDVEPARALVRLISAQEAALPPAFVVYADDAPDQLAGHIAAGLDYVLPPFLPDVLRGRLFACRGQVELDQTARRLETDAQMIKYERELQIGREIQVGFLPTSLPVPIGWEIEARFAPAREVAGDFYDGFDMVGGRRLGFIIADVCDKGVGAALFMALIRSLLRNTASYGGSLSMVGLDVKFADSPGENARLLTSGVTTAGVAPLVQAIVGTNHYLTENHLEQGYFATLFFGVLDPTSGSLLYINCGHNPPLIRRSTGELVPLPPTGPALGMLPGSTFRLGQAQLDFGNTLFLYTDGVPEAKDIDGRFFSMPRMSRILTEPVAGAYDLIERIQGELNEHIGAAAQFDDITMMALHRVSEPTSAHVAGAEKTTAAR